MVVSRREIVSTPTPPWLLMWPVVIYSLYSADKADIPSEIHKHRFYELSDQYANYCSIYTDGSKVGDRVALAIVYKGITKSVRLPDLTSLLSWTICFIVGNRCYSPVKVFTTEFAVYNIDNDLVQNLLKNTQCRQSKEKPSLYVGFQVMSVFLEMRRPILL